MFKSLVGRGHPEFSTRRQQDAQEFLLHLLNSVEVCACVCVCVCVTHSKSSVCVCVCVCVCDHFAPVPFDCKDTEIVVNL